jgi:outer membrane protein W
MTASRVSAMLTLMLGGGILSAAPAGAQSGDGYLFGPPSVTIGVHGGLSRADAGSEVFSFVTDLLTLGKNDFTGYAGGSNLSFSVGSRAAVGLGVTYSERSSRSEYRDWVDQDDLPIEQTTSFLRLPVMATGRYYLLPRGRSVGSFAWIPATFAPYVGGGAGVIYYRFRQEGDFIDYVDDSVFTTTLESSGWSTAAQGFAGVDYTLTPRLLLNGEAGYLRSNAELNSAFGDFDGIDLSGFSATVGISLRL